jgi:hypothetical protein
MQKITLFLFATLFSALSFAALNPYAYGSSSELSADKTTLSVKYLLNADATPVTNGDIWKEAEKPLLARWTSDYDCGYETNWWYVIKDTVFDMSSLKAKRRYEINKGIKNFDVKVISPAEHVNKLCEITKKAYEAWPKKYRPDSSDDKIVAMIGNNDFFTTLFQALDTYYAQETLENLPVTEDVRMIIDNFENKFNVDTVSNNAYNLQDVIISKKKVKRNLAVLIDTVIKHEQSISNIEKEIILIAILHNLQVSEETMRNIVNSAMGFNPSVGGQAL